MIGFKLLFSHLSIELNNNDSSRKGSRKDKVLS